MRPLRLEMEGFGTFAKRTTVDFTETDFFALIGPTGSGKSTVLDAMCFALYGRVPRWGAGIEYALAPSATSGKVQLVFRADQRMYVATRVVKRGGKGKVTTSAAGMELLPEKTKLSELDNVAALLGTSLTSSAKGVSEHAERIIGLPFEQFTKCVLLPQGAFAEFLHSSGAERRKILENLLGYSVYRDIQTVAGERARDAETTVRLFDQQLSALPQIEDADLTAAAERIERLKELDGTVREAVPRLDSVAAEVEAIDRAVAEVDAEHAILTYIRTPDNVDALAAELAEATDETKAAADVVTSAEEGEQRLRQERSTIDVSTVDEQLRAYDRADELADSIEKGQPLTERAETEAHAAETTARAAAEAVTEAEDALRHAQLGRLAETLRADLSPGDACPVCARPVAELPDDGEAHELRDHEALLKRAKTEHSEADRAARQAQLTAANYRTRLDERLIEKEENDKLLAQAPDRRQLEEVRRRADETATELDAAAGQIRAARDALRRAERRRDETAARLATEWQKYDHHRDKVARLSPPPTDRGDLAASWRTLTTWSASELAQRKRRRTELSEQAAELTSRRRVLGNELARLLTEAGLAPIHDGSGADYVAAIAAGAVAAEDHLRRITEQRAAFSTLSEQRAEQLDRARVAKQLHQHLGTRQFVNWLLTEALDDLVAGASGILRQITGGQYDLAYQDNDFLVVDHHDADLTRPVRTLSGGETFAASLALALAMSKQLSGMSSQGANLEAILLDEGFGTLDAATLDQVAATLEGLADSGDRMVGVITHVAALAERIPVRFEVSKDAFGSRVTKSED